MRLHENAIIGGEETIRMKSDFKAAFTRPSLSTAVTMINCPVMGILLPIVLRKLSNLTSFLSSFHPITDKISSYLNVSSLFSMENQSEGF